MSQKDGFLQLAENIEEALLHDDRLENSARNSWMTVLAPKAEHWDLALAFCIHLLATGTEAEDGEDFGKISAFIWPTHLRAFPLSSGQKGLWASWSRKSLRNSSFPGTSGGQAISKNCRANSAWPV